MAKHDNTSVEQGVEKQPGAGKKRGRKRKADMLSPNKTDKELARERAKPPRRRAATSRGRTVGAKRKRELLRRERRKALKRKRLGGQEAGAVVRRRLRCIRRYRQLRTTLLEKKAAEQAAAESGCSVSSVRLWDRMQRKGGNQALLPKPRGPRAPQRRVPPQVEQMVVMLRQRYGWNEKRIAHELKQRGLATISHTTVGNIFARNNLPTRTYHGKARSEGLSYKRYEKEHADAQWHMDFAQINLTNGETVYLVVVVDDYSRFCLTCEVIAATSTELVQLLYRRLCQRYGVAPAEMVTDNGRAFMSVYEDIPTRFGLELAEHGTRHRRTAPYYPEGNGKAEAFVKTMKREALNHSFVSVAAVHSALAEFQTFYNYYRLHSSLNYQPPAVRYWNVAAPHNHGLQGLPQLPDATVAAYPGEPEFQPVDIDPAVRRRALALVPITC